jgi:hypothetical protein
MKKNMHLLPGGLFSLVIILLGLITAINACKKSSDDNGNNFAGTYPGTISSGIYSEADTITIPSGSSSTITMNTRTGIGSTYSISGTTSGNTVTIPSQSVTISNLGATYTVTGTGTLSNSTLVIHYSFVSASSVTTNWTFNGSKN